MPRNSLAVCLHPLGADNLVSFSTNAHIREFFVVGGEMLNNGETDASYLVHHQKDNLERVIYLPTRTKGGAFVRPHYFELDRAGRDTFTNLRDICCSIDAQPDVYGWDAPQLRRLVLAWPRAESPSADDAKKMAEEENVSPLQFHDADLRFGTETLLRLARSYPALEEIDLGGFRFHSDATCRLHLVHRFLTPVRLSWEVHRVLLLGVLKEHSAHCPMARLPLELVNVILSCGVTRGWVHFRPLPDEFRAGSVLF